VITLLIAWLECAANVSLGRFSNRVTDSTFGLFDLAFTPIVASHHFSQTDHLAFDFTFWAPTASYSDEEMHATLEINIPNYASAIVTTNKVIDSISSLEP
jgi:outer membrane putative beta-barrel porin/alpha-amylase